MRSSLGWLGEGREEAGSGVQRYDLISGFAFFVLGGAVALEAVALEVGSPSRPGPGFLPFVLGALLMLWSLLLALASLHHRSAREEPRAERVEPARESRVLYVAIALVAYALVFEVLGYVLSTFALLCALFVGVWPRRKRLAVGAAAIALVCTYVLFVVWLKVRLPPGVFAGRG